MLLVMTVVTMTRAQKNDLRLHLEKGKEYSQAVSAKTTVTQNLQGQEMQTDITITGNTAFLVKGEDEKFYEMELRYKSLGMRMSMAGNTMEFSSDKPGADDPLSKILVTFIDKPFMVRMSKKGKIEEVKGMDKLWEGIIGQVGAMDEAQKQQIKQQMVDAFGEKSLRGSIEMVTAIFPENPVAVGEKWVLKGKLESVTQADITTTYELKDFSSDSYTISGKANVVTPENSDFKTTNGFPVKYDLKGTTTSEIKVDAKTGWIIESKMVQELKGQAMIKPGDQLPNGMVIPMSMRAESTIRNK